MLRAGVQTASRQHFRGDLLRALVKASGVKADSIARHLDVNKGALSKWQSGSDRPKQANIQGLCDYFQVAQDYFFDDREQNPIMASVVAGHIATFTQAAPVLDNARRRIIVFQTGAPKAPSWWRQKLQGAIQNKSV
jgi:transcriptional regulator with XRE-family HTH domain